MKKLKEKEIRRTVQDYIKIKGYFYWWNLAGLGCYGGLPDIFLHYNGQLIGIEFKTERGKQSENQIEFEQQFENTGGKYFVIRSLDDFLEAEKSF